MQQHGTKFASLSAHFTKIVTEETVEFSTGNLIYVQNQCAALETVFAVILLLVSWCSFQLSMAQLFPD